VTHEERVKRVAGFGFTHRQAAFLVEVMLHSGFFLGRQYCTFARIVRGQKLVDFLHKLTSRKLATPYLCGHSKARVYHLHHAALYEAIEQRDVRFRKRMAVGQALERLMILDHVITHREFRWLGSEQDKVAHFLTTTSLERDALPRLAFGVTPNVTVRHFPDKLPIGVSPDGRMHAFLYLLVNPVPYDFRVFLRRHAELLRSLPAWSIRLLVPVQQTDRDGWAQHLADDYEGAFRQELAAPLDTVTANELRWFWEARTLGSGVVEEKRMRRARRIFGTPRFRGLRRALELDGPRAVDVAMSRSLADAIERKEGRFERHEMRRQYLRLSHLVGTA
jgi:hypothetical protein